MNLRTSLCAILSAGLMTGVLVLPCRSDESEKPKDKQTKLEAKAKVTKEEATKIALSKVAKSTVKECELEKEHGKLIWSFDIASPDIADITEVQVDAKTGKVISVEKETPAAQEKEKQGGTGEQKNKKAKDKD